MFKHRAMKIYAAKIFAVLSISALLVELILKVSTSMGFGKSGSFHIPGVAVVFAIIFILILMYATYSMVWKHLGWIKFGAKQAAIVIAIIDVIVGYFFLGIWALIGGVLLLLSWIALKV